MKTLSRIVFFISCLLLSFNTLGKTESEAKEQAGPISAELSAYLVERDASGKEKLAKADKAKPGNVIEYQLTYKNNSNEPLKDLIVVGPIPKNTEYLKDSAKAKVKNNFEVTIDEGKNWQTPPVYQEVTSKDGVKEKVIVPESQYNQIRWVISSDLLPGKTEDFTYRVKVYDVSNK